MHTKTAFVLLTAIASAGVAGCGGKDSSDDGSSPTGTVRASLHRAKSCGDLLTDLKADAIYKLDRGIDRQIQSIKQCQAKYFDAQCANGGYYGGGFGGERAVAEDSASPPQATPTSGADSSNDGSSGKSASSFSQTNVQVQGVDEADIVKNDGKNLYVLHGRAFKIVNAWPATALAEVSSTDIEGTPTEMFVEDGKAVIYSQVNGTAIFAAAGVTPKTQFTEYGYADSGGRATPVAPGATSDSGYPGSSGPYHPLTKITVLSLEGAAPTVTREVYFEGSYLDARRVGQHVRTVLQGYQYGPQLKYSIYDLYAPTTKDPNGNVNGPTEDVYPKTGTQSIAALEKLRATNKAILNASQLGDWLPYTFLKNGAAVTASTTKCEDFYVPTAGSTASGLTEVASLDLANPAAAPQETVVLGRADTVYGNASTLYLAAQAWVEPPFIWYGGDGDTVSSDGVASSPPSSGSGGATAPSPPPAPEQDPAVGTRTLRPLADPTSKAQPLHYAASRTHVHKFEFATQPTFPNYVASGSVDGAVLNQFSLDEKDGRLRIATTETRNYYLPNGQYVSADSSAPVPGQPAPTRPSTISHVFVLSQNGAWLDTTGDVGLLAPNEQIKSVRFVENRGYVVTFRQVDPLFVVDLAAPAKPTLLAALKIDGFSEYMHPLDATHLLTIGRDAGPDGRTRGLQLQIFDVTNGANPILQHKFTYTGEEYGGSEAEYDHKAFTYFADKQLLAFPYYSYGQNGPKSTLELFKVDLAAGFSKLGSIDHSGFLQSSPKGYCGYTPSVRRGVFLESFVYSISYGGVVVKDATNLGQAGTQLALPAPEANDGYAPAVCY